MLRNPVRFFLIACVALSCKFAAAESPERPPLEAFFKAPEIGNVVLSPDGSRMALTIRTKDGRVGVATCSTQDFKDCALVLHQDDTDVLRVYWVNNKRLLVATGDLQQVYGRLDGRWYAADADGSNVLPITDPHPIIILGTVNDGSDDILIGHVIFKDTTRTFQSVHPVRTNSRTLHKTEILDAGLPALPKRWVFDLDDQPAAFYAQDKGITTVYARTDPTAPWKDIAHWGVHSGENMYPLGFDGSHRLLVTDRREGDLLELYSFDLNQGLSKTSLVAIKNFDVAGSLDIDETAKKVLGLHYESDAAGSVWFDPTMRAAQQAVDASLPDTINTLYCGNCLSTKKIVVVARSDRAPPVFFLFDSAAKQLFKIGTSRPAIKPAEMGSKSFVHVTARDGTDIPTYITFPPGPRDKPAPAVVMVHGGPWARGAFGEWEPISQFLATRGYVVIEPQFRGSRGFGDALFKAGFKQWGQAMQDDVTDATKWAIAKGYVDPARIAIGGASYGGYATLMGLIKEPKLYRCGFEWVGITDENLIFSEAWNDESDDNLNYYVKEMVADPEVDQAMMQANSPLANAAKLNQPLLMAYGSLDRRVPFEQGTAFYDAVSAHNQNVEFNVYKGEGHGWSREEDNIDFWRRVEKFLAKNLAPQ